MSWPMFYVCAKLVIIVIPEHSLPYPTFQVFWPQENRSKETVSVLSSCPNCPSNPAFVTLASSQPLDAASTWSRIVLDAEGWQLNPSPRDTDLDLNNTLTYKTHQLIYIGRDGRQRRKKAGKGSSKRNKGTKRQASWPKTSGLMTTWPRYGFNTDCEASW